MNDGNDDYEVNLLPILLSCGLFLVGVALGVILLDIRFHTIGNYDAVNWIQVIFVVTGGLFPILTAWHVSKKKIQPLAWKIMFLGFVVVVFLLGFYGEHIIEGLMRLDRWVQRTVGLKGM